MGIHTMIWQPSDAMSMVVSQFCEKIFIFQPRGFYFVSCQRDDVDMRSPRLSLCGQAGINTAGMHNSRSRSSQGYCDCAAAKSSCPMPYSRRVDFMLRTLIQDPSELVPIVQMSRLSIGVPVHTSTIHQPLRTSARNHSHPGSHCDACTTSTDPSETDTSGSFP